MHQLSVIGEPSKGNDALCQNLAQIFEIERRSLSELTECVPGPYTVVDFNLGNVVSVPALRDWVRRKPSGAKIVFVTAKGSHLEMTRAFAIGATDVVYRPVDPKLLLGKLQGDVAALSGDPANEAIKKSPGVRAAVGTLQNIFSSASFGEAIEASAVDNASDVVIDSVEAKGLRAWIDIVRTHHSLTYQHCLLVTGLAVAFGQRIGVSHGDRRRLSFAGMLHDIGKARVPLAILEKPGKLDADEMNVMRKHPEFGLDALKSMPNLPREMLDMVVHHHEYLDGSGYPHGLGSGEIADLVRMITIADVFGALIEWRAYKPPMAGTDAYKILVDMGPKLDQDLVRAFQEVVRVGQ